MSKIEDNPPENASQTVEEKGAPTHPPAGKTPPRKGGKAAWTGAAVGIGSAAIVAALLYTNKKRS
jgi:hypothetical protein